MGDDGWRGSRECGSIGLIVNVPFIAVWKLRASGSVVAAVRAYVVVLPLVEVLCMSPGPMVQVADLG